MGKPCTVCVHPDRGAIDAALEVGQPLRRLAGAYGRRSIGIGRRTSPKNSPPNRQLEMKR